MADLYRIFNEEGLAGLIPYALKETSHGYRILVDKIKAGHPLSFILTHMETPFLVVKNGTYQALFYTSEEGARAQAAELRAQGHRPGVEDLPDGRNREEALLWLFDHGPTHILLNDALSIPIKELVSEVPDYDGQPNSEHMLRNRALAGATFYYLQQATSGHSNLEAERTWAQAMLHGKFLAACINDRTRDYPALAIDVKGRTGLLVYTDWRQVMLDHKQRVPPCAVIEFDDLRALLGQAPGSLIVFNHATCDLHLDMDLLDAIGQAGASHAPAAGEGGGLLAVRPKNTYALGQVPEEEWETADPMPDFLK
ncbi:hypothetical protein [uncultured Flavonifractor sp.]|uniref:hypothetical protein n=1 Tax=uncultured Flavonifractor sp. TaxID=1193534 RepID=UPI0025974A91|nr:hypothetical protein [uncultured Flavonifractor sp.]